jgi:hypothetical protein
LSIFYPGSFFKKEIQQILSLEALGAGASLAEIMYIGNVEVGCARLKHSMILFSIGFLKYEPN